jgi:hypothetical protein
MVHIIKNIICPILGRSSWSPLENKKQKKPLSKFSACETRLGSRFFFHFFHGHMFFQTQSQFFKKEGGIFKSYQLFNAILD